MGEKVLCVDDDANLLDALRHTLRREEFDLITAGSAAEAIELLRKQDVAVVVSDQDMPGLDGTEFLRLVHECYPDTVRIMLTGCATLDVAVAAINDGAISRFLTKPCDSLDLTVTIRQALDHRKLKLTARRLLLEVKRQRDLIAKSEGRDKGGDGSGGGEGDERARLEQSHPGISRVERNEDGAVVVEEDISLDELLRQAKEYFEAEASDR